VSRHGHAFIDRALYLPKEWTDDPERMTAAHVPDDVGFATKPQIARRMIARAIAAKVPFAFVAADSVYGTGDIETMLRKAGKGYVLGVAARSRTSARLLSGGVFPNPPETGSAPIASSTSVRWNGRMVPLHADITAPAPSFGVEGAVMPTVPTPPGMRCQPSRHLTSTVGVMQA
jgi:hypothetical protein